MHHDDTIDGPSPRDLQLARLLGLANGLAVVLAVGTGSTAATLWWWVEAAGL